MGADVVEDPFEHRGEIRSRCRSKRLGDRSHDEQTSARRLGDIAESPDRRARSQVSVRRGVERDVNRINGDIGLLGCADTLPMVNSTRRIQTV